jgi:hypothetical protein
MGYKVEPDNSSLRPLVDIHGRQRVGHGFLLVCWRDRKDRAAANHKIPKLGPGRNKQGWYSPISVEALLILHKKIGEGKKERKPKGCDSLFRIIWAEAEIRDTQKRHPSIRSLFGAWFERKSISRRLGNDPF